MLLEMTTLAQTLQVVWVVIAPHAVFVMHVHMSGAATALIRARRFEQPSPLVCGAPVGLGIWDFGLPICRCRAVWVAIFRASQS